MKTNFLIVATFLAGFALAKIGNQPTDTKFDDTEALIAKGVEQMQILGERSAEVNQAVKTKFETMKETIEVLEVEKEQLAGQVKEMEDEINIIKSASVQPFDVLAIGLPDTTSRK